jgi:hypothetical protein
MMEEQIISPYEAEGRKIDAGKRSRIAELPDILVVRLKRFEYDLETCARYKVNDKFEFPEVFDFGPYTVNPNGPQVYKLTGVVVHVGHVEAGHYLSFIRIGQTWVCFNDTKISDVSDSSFKQYVNGGLDDIDINGPSAYLLFYSKSEYSYLIPNARMIDAIPPKLQAEIEAENKSHIHHEAVFSEQMAKFVVAEIKNIDSDKVFCECSSSFPERGCHRSHFREDYDYLTRATGCN